jgi:RND family efflux transporter MFP subunit
MSPHDQSTARPDLHRLRVAGVSFLILIVAILVYGVVSRAAQSSRIHDLTEAQAVPNVAVVAPSSVENHTGLELPGRLEAFIRAPIYARVPGYLKSWKYDIGSKVKAGELLAEIDTPDLDQQLMQARADLNVAQANAKLSDITAKRWQSLAGTDAVAKQDVDQRTFTADANLAQVKAAQASLDRLVAEEGFKRLIAPFDGIVTARETDIGQLINVGATGGAELFVVSETGKLRIYVNVPQNYVPSVPSGTKATITVPEHPGKTYSGTVEASAQAVNPSSGTTLMQIIVDNSTGELRPGDYASIRLQVAPAADVLSVPSSAVIFDAKGLSIATVGGDNRVALKPVTIGRDLGAVVEIASGLAPNDRVIQNPPDGVAGGDIVHVIDAPAAKNTHG